MKYRVVIGLIVIITGVNVFLQLELKRLKEVLSKEQINNQWVVNTLQDNVRGVFDLDSIGEISVNYRIPKTACIDCVLEGVLMIKNVYGENAFQNKVTIHSALFDETLIDKYNPIKNLSQITKYDSAASPYIYYTNEHDDIIFLIRFSDDDNYWSLEQNFIQLIKELIES